VQFEIGNAFTEKAFFFGCNVPIQAATASRVMLSTLTLDIVKIAQVGEFRGIHAGIIRRMPAARVFPGSLFAHSCGTAAQPYNPLSPARSACQEPVRSLRDNAFFISWKPSTAARLLAANPS
jgi:hypothetical protein